MNVHVQIRFMWCFKALSYLALKQRDILLYVILLDGPLIITSFRIVVISSPRNKEVELSLPIKLL